jgi:hypothetical protein
VRLRHGFEIAKTTNGYANSPTSLVSFNLADGAYSGGLIADANGNLFGTTGVGTVFEIIGSGFVVPVTLAVTPGKANCHGKSVPASAREYGGLNGAAAVLGYASMETPQKAILAFREGQQGRSPFTMLVPIPGRCNVRNLAEQDRVLWIVGSTTRPKNSTYPPSHQCPTAGAHVA